MRIVLAHEVDQQAAEADDLQVLHVAQHLARHVDALLQREERALRRAFGDAEHQRAEQAARAPHQILVAAGERVESAGVDRLDHRLSRSW